MKFLPLFSSVIHCYMSQFQTAGISSILIQMLRYFTDTQTVSRQLSQALSDRLIYYFLYFHGIEVGQ